MRQSVASALGKTAGRVRKTVLLAILAIFALFPIVWMILTSFKTRRDIYGVVLFFKPQFESYVDIFTRNRDVILTGLSNSLIVACLSSIIILIFGTMAGYSLSRMAYPGRKAVLYGILATRLLPPVVVIFPLFMAFQALKLIDTVVVVAVLHSIFNLPMCVWLMKSFFDTVPKSLEEAAFIDGASGLQTAFRIVLPLVAGGIATSALFSFVFSWNEFQFALVFTQRYARTAPIVLANATYGEAEIFWSDMSALATIMMVPGVLVTFIGQKYLVRGLTLGSVK
jgi:multiple sugar transport system permease protein